MIRLIIITMLCSQILWKSRHSRQPRLDHLGLPERTAPHCHPGRHLPRLRFEVSLVVPHHALRQREDITFQAKQIRHRIVILKAVHPPNRRLEILLLPRQRLMEQVLKVSQKLLPRLRLQLRFILRRHFLKIDCLHNTLQQLRLRLQLLQTPNLQQIHLPLHLPVLAMTGNTVLLKYPQHTLGSLQTPGKSQNQKNPKSPPGHCLEPIHFHQTSF